MKLSTSLLAAFVLFGSALAQTEIWTKITATPGAPSLSITVADFGILSPGDAALSEATRTVRDVLVRDLDNSLFFQLRRPEAGKTLASGTANVDFASWAATGATVLIAADMSRTSFTLRVYDLLSKRLVASKDYARLDNPRTLGHRVADEIIKLLTGEEGVSRSRIVLTRRAGRTRELYTVDQDGLNLQQLTNDGAIKLSPDWSPDGSRVAYSSYSGHKLIAFSRNLSTGTTSIISSRADMNDAPAWSPDGRRVAVALSTDRGEEIFVVDVGSGNAEQVTRNGAISTSPAWSPNGSQIAFVSDRAGSPQIYTVNADGSNQHRVTFEGNYNTSPAWSPRGNIIAFSRRDGGINQIWIADLEGENSKQLTFSGDNIEPCFSPDGLHIAFVSTRTGDADLYSMNWDGTNQRRLTTIGGCSTPSWSQTE